MSFGKRILLLVPHADDEVVAASATIGRAQKEGCDIKLLQLTNGCMSKDTLWLWKKTLYDQNVAIRRQESQIVADFLNVTLLEPTNRPTRQARHEMVQIYNEICRMVQKHAIDQIWVLAYEGGHADHDVINACAYRVSKDLGISTIEFAAYNNCPQQDKAQTFPVTMGNETIVTLTDEEKHRKDKALSLYASEKHNLGYIGREKECYRPLAAYDYSKPPHKGLVWYARFHWVPFRHPRIDFTTPQDVSKAIAVFMSNPLQKKI